MERQRYYLCIDMKTFYASVECAERNLNPFETNLVVADSSRGKNALCLAITPKMKAQGIRNRCRMSEIPKTVKFMIAPPQMQLYIDYAADIYSIYLDYFDARDIYVYSIDESFIDITAYMEPYKKTPKEFAVFLMNEIATRKHIPSTAGIGTNMYLAKIALDITAKHAKDHMGFLDEDLYKKTLWKHRPITDFWQIASGTAKRLEKYAIYDMEGIAKAPDTLLYRIFGKDAELLIDHAWGRESCLIEDIKNYKSKSKSVSFSQILPRDYSFEEAKIVLMEMIIHGAQELMRRHVISNRIGIFVAYSREEFPATGGTCKLNLATNLSSKILTPVIHLYENTTYPYAKIRRLGIAFENVCDESCEGYDFFTDFERDNKEKRTEQATICLNARYGKNTVLRGINLLDGATQRERNTFIGGHRAGDDTSRKS